MDASKLPTGIVTAATLPLLVIAVAVFIVIVAAVLVVASKVTGRSPGEIAKAIAVLYPAAIRERKS